MNPPKEHHHLWLSTRPTLTEHTYDVFNICGSLSQLDVSLTSCLEIWFASAILLHFCPQDFKGLWRNSFWCYYRIKVWKGRWVSWSCHGHRWCIASRWKWNDRGTSTIRIVYCGMLCACRLKFPSCWGKMIVPSQSSFNQASDGLTYMKCWCHSHATVTVIIHYA